MRICRPVSDIDADKLESAIALMLHHGGLERHVVTLAPSQSVRHIAEAAATRLEGHVAEVNVLDIPFQSDGRWPQSPNMHWAITMDVLRSMGNNDPIFWMELDCDPVEPGWADDIEHGWRAGRKPFFGKQVRTPQTNAQGQIVYEKDDYMMMGCMVYPPNLVNHPHKEIYFKGIYAGTNPEPWDKFLRGWFSQMGWMNTHLIGDRWNTINYRLQDGELLCDPGEVSFTASDHSKSDILGAKVIHGCKDGTLAELIFQYGSLTQMLTGQPPVPAKGKIVTPSFVPTAPEIPQEAPKAFEPSPAQGTAKTVMELQIRVDALERAQIEGLNREAILTRRIEALENAIQNLNATFKPVEDMQPAVSPQIQTIRGMVAERKKGITQTAAYLGMDREQLTEIIQSPGSGLKLHKGWISLDNAA